MTTPEAVPTLLVVFTGVVALAILLQALALIGLYRRFRDLSTRVAAVSAKVTKQLDSFGAQADSFFAMAKETAEKVHAMQENLTASTKVIHERIKQVDAFVAETTDAARLQMARLQDVIETTSQRFDETIEIVRDAIVVPATEVQAIVNAVRTGFNVFFSRRRSAVRSHHDEEMFI